MLTASLKQLPWMLALFVLGPIAGHLTGSLRAADGSGDATVLVGVAPAGGIIAGVVTLALAGLVGVFASRVNGSRSGLNNAGIVIAWAASQTATMDSLLRHAGSGQPLTMLGIEGAIFCLLLAPIAAVIWQAGLGRGLHGAFHPLPDGSPTLAKFLTGGARQRGGLRPAHQSLSATLLRSLLRTSSVGAIAATVAAGAVVTYLVCQDALKGQAIFGAALTGIVAVPLGRLAGESLDEQPPLAAFVVGYAVLALAGPLAAKFFQGASLIPDVYGGKLLGVAVPVTLDWLAGACIGLPIGEAWFHAMFQTQAAKAGASR